MTFLKSTYHLSQYWTTSTSLHRCSLEWFKRELESISYYYYQNGNKNSLWIEWIVQNFFPSTYTSCTDALLANCFRHAIYPICLDSLKSPLTIECKLDDNGSSVAVLRHDNENATLSPGFEARGSYRRVFNYNLPLESIIAVINQLSHCRQFTKAKCFHAELSRNTWLSDRPGQKLEFWGGGPSEHSGCFCGIYNRCADPKQKCNCDSNDKKWRLDEVYIRKKDALPITAINVGDTGSATEKFNKLLAQ